MCSRYSLTSPHNVIRAYFAYGNEHTFPPRYNIAPTAPAAIVRAGARHDRELILVRWGLIPSWVRDIDTFSTLINARAETVGQKPSFRGPLRHKRCLVPADGFYEWTGSRGNKQPHYVHRTGWQSGMPEGKLSPLAFAGLYEDWLGPDGSEIDTMAVITVPSNDTMRPIHDRMPALLEPEDFEAWLDCRNVDVEEAVSLLRPAPEAMLSATPVSTAVNDPRAEGPDLLSPAAPKLL